MMRALSIIIITLLGLYPFAVLSKAEPQTDLYMQFALQPVDASVAFYQLQTEVDHRPSPLLMNGRAYLMYEVFITNVGSQAFRIDRIDLLDGDRPDRILASYNGSQLQEMMYSFQRNEGNGKGLILRPGIHQVLYFMPGFANRGEIPTKLIHRFILVPANGHDDDQSGVRTLQMHAALTPVDGASPMTMAPPLHGEHWLAANAPSNVSMHRRVHVTNHGMMFFPERYALDFMRFGANGKLYDGDSGKNASYFAYGANVYATAPGKVVAVIDGIPDNNPGGRDYPITLANIAGNYVIIDMGKSRYALYAHLIPHSLTVKRGDTIEKGQLLGRVGNSGNSDAPHLHFHVMDRPSILSAQGVPYAFDQFAIEPYTVPDPDADEPNIIFSKKPVVHKNELMRENTVVNFEGN